MRLLPLLVPLLLTPTFLHAQAASRSTPKPFTPAEAEQTAKQLVRDTLVANDPRWMGVSAAALEPVLTQHFTDIDPSVRRAAIRILYHSKVRGPAIVPVLDQAFRDPDIEPQLRPMLLRMTFQVRNSAAPLLPHLMAYYDSPARCPREPLGENVAEWRAMQEIFFPTIAVIGRVSAPFADRLVWDLVYRSVAINAPDLTSREKRLVAERQARHLVPLPPCSDATNKGYVARALRAMGPEAIRPHADELLTVLHRDDIPSVEAAMSSDSLLSWAKPAPATYVLTVLGEEIVPRLRHTLHTRIPGEGEDAKRRDVRHQALWALALIGTPTAQQAILDIVRNHQQILAADPCRLDPYNSTAAVRDFNLQQAALVALPRIGLPDGVDAVTLLRPYLQALDLRCKGDLEGSPNASFRRVSTMVLRTLRAG